ncbi:MAG: Asp23/Gls24 family envelope stress response protein [Firmicutes bacterium]|nr:Asp23/Gls24 family envelope stress response protein [Bacillota bacterium]
MIHFENERGGISLTENVVARVVTETARSFGGRILFSNQRGKLLKVGNTGKEHLSFIQVEETEDGKVDIRFYVVIRFGTSIHSLEKELGPAIRENVRKVTGLEVNALAMTITGVKSKKIGRRQLEIEL